MPQLKSVLLVCQLLIAGAHAQGRMLEPPSRMSAWRLGYNVPINYNDHVMNCGSIQNQWGRNGGKCGICGESWSGVRQYERPNGELVQHSIITKSYVQGDVISVMIELTYNQKGWVEFRICDVASSGGIEATQSCLAKTVLSAPDGRTRFPIPLGAKGFLSYSLVLPKGFSCVHCVMQWKWKTGSSWGCDMTGCGLGHGDAQDEYYACADVAVMPKTANIISALSSTTTPSTTAKTNTTVVQSFPCNGNQTVADFTKLSDRVEYLKMLLGQPNSYKNGCKNPQTPLAAANIVTPSQCVVNKDAVDRLCFACYPGCKFEVCYVLCPQRCTVIN